MKPVLVMDFYGPRRPIAESPLFRDQAENRNDAVLDGFAQGCALLPVLVEQVEVRPAKVEIVS